MAVGTPQALTARQARELQQAFGLFQGGQFELALAIGRRLVAEVPDSPDAYQLLGMCLGAAGSIEEAERAFDHALVLAPGHPLILANYATLLGSAGRHDAAVAILQRAVAAAPQSPKAWTDLGANASAAGRHALAIAALGRAVELQPASISAWNMLGGASNAAGELDTAQKAFETAIALNPEHPSATINLAAVLRLAGRPDAAVDCLDRLGKSGYGGPEFTDSLVGALLDDGRWGEALQLAKRMVHEYPDFVPGLTTLTNLLWEYAPALDTHEEPFDLFRTAIQQQPANHELRRAFARLLLTARSADEALAQVRIARTQADDPSLVLMEANALAMVGETRQAGDIYERQMREGWGSRSPALLNAYTCHLLQGGEWEAAARVAASATQLDPGNQEAWAYLGVAWRLTDDPREDWLCDYDRLVGLVDIDAPSGYADAATFLDKLGASLGQLHGARREPIQQSLRGGSQTPGRLFGRRDAVIADLQSELRKGIERWLATLPEDDKHPFLRQNSGRIRFGGSWSVKLWSSGRHVNHIHPEGWMSSAFYVSLPPSIGSGAGSEAGFIQFGQPPVELKLDLPPRRVIRPQPGKLVLFPSYFWHGTVPFEDTLPRVTIAFDMNPARNATTTLQ